MEKILKIGGAPEVHLVSSVRRVVRVIADTCSKNEEEENDIGQRKKRGTFPKRYSTGSVYMALSPK